MKLLPFRLAAGLFAFGLVMSASAAAFKWTGLRIPCKISAPDGVTNLGVKIGKFLPLPEDEYAHAIFNVHNRFQSSKPWATLAVGPVPDAQTPSSESQEQFLARMDALGVQIFLELYPRKTNNVTADIDQWLSKFKGHKCVAGLGIDLESYKKADDASVQAWDQRIKSHNPSYRLFLKHWDEAFMPPTYRGQGDLIFINTSSEASVDALNEEFAKWAAKFAPSACAIQIGYPADEDKGQSSGGWWRLQDPIKNWGDSLLAKIGNTNQELGLLWVQVKSGKTYNANWDITKGATLAAGGSNIISASAPPLRSSPELAKLTTIFDGKTFTGWECNPAAWTIINGAMRGQGKGGNAFTKQDHGSFRLIVTSRVNSPEGNPGRDHLGVLFWGEHSTNFGTAKALQVQPPHGAMWDYRTNKGLKPEHPTPRPRPRYQDWHTCEILANIQTGEVLAAVDGLQVTRYQYDPALLKPGPIGMQIHGNEGVFEYKDIRLEPNPADARLITVK